MIAVPVEEARERVRVEVRNDGFGGNQRAFLWCGFEKARWFVVEGAELPQLPDDDVTAPRFQVCGQIRAPSTVRSSAG